MEVIAYSGGFQIYLRYRKAWPAARVSIEQNLWIIVGAIFGALIGAKMLAWLESAPDYWRHRFDPGILLAGKTIVGGLLGGWIGVEIAKKVQNVRHSTGDAFVFPLIFGMAVGRIGCFFTGVADNTHGVASNVPWAIDEGDGIRRHPTQLYDIVFLSCFAILLALVMRRPFANGRIFRLFLLGYLCWRFTVEFIKTRYTYGGLSAIQMACALGAIVLAWMIFAKARREPEGIAVESVAR